MKGCLCKKCDYFTEIYDGTGNCERTKSMTDETCGCEFGIESSTLDLENNSPDMYGVLNS